MYNEEASELYLTLKSVWRMEKNLRENGWPKLKFKICVIQDGWSKVSQSAREAMEKMFPSPDGKASVPSKLDEVVKSELREYLVPRSGEAPVVFDHLVPFSVYCDICQEVQRVQPLSSKKKTSKFDRPVTYRQMCIAYIEDGKELSHGQLNWRWQKLEKVPGSGNNLSLEDFKEALFIVWIATKNGRQQSAKWVREVGPSWRLAQLARKAQAWAVWKKRRGR